MESVSVKSSSVNTTAKPGSSSANLVTSVFQQVHKQVPHALKALTLQPIRIPPEKMKGEMPDLKPKEKELLQEMFSKWPLSGGPTLLDLFGLAIFEKWEALFNMASLEPTSMPNQKEHYQNLRDLFDSRFVVCYHTILNNTGGALPSTSEKFFLQPEKFTEEVCSLILKQILDKKFIVIANTGAAQAKAKLIEQKWTRVKEKAKEVHDLIALLQKFLKSCPVLLSTTNAFPQNVPSQPAKSLEMIKDYCRFADHYFKIGDGKSSVTGFYDTTFLEIPKMVDAFLKSPKPATWIPIDLWFFNKMQSNGDAQHSLYFSLNKAKAQESYTYKQFCQDTKISNTKDLSREDFLSCLSTRILARHIENMFLWDIYTSFIRLIDSKQNAAEFPCFHLYLTRLAFNFSIILQTYRPPSIESTTPSSEAESSMEKFFHPIHDQIAAHCLRMILHFSSEHVPLMIQSCDVLEKGVRNFSLLISAFSVLKKGNPIFPPVIELLPSILKGISSIHQNLVQLLKQGKESGAIKAEDRDSIRQMLIDDALFLSSFVMFLQDANWLYVNRPNVYVKDSLPEELVDFLLLEEFDTIFQEPESAEIEEIVPPKVEVQQVPQKQEEKVAQVYAKKQKKVQKQNQKPALVSTVAPKAEIEPPSKQEILKTTKLRKLNKLLKKYGYDQSESGVGSHTKVYNEEARDQIVEPRRLKKGLLNRFYNQLHGAWEKSQKKD